MSDKRHSLEHVAPWLGLLAAGLAWFVAQQVSSNAVFDDCRAGDGGFLLLVGLVALLIAAAGGYFSWDVWRQGRKETEGRRFIGLLGALLAALAAFLIVLQSVSALILPRCVA